MKRIWFRLAEHNLGAYSEVLHVNPQSAEIRTTNPMGLLCGGITCQG
jgi:hypothetical protein